MSNNWKVRTNAEWKKDYEHLFRTTPKKLRRKIAYIKWMKHVTKNAHEERICA